MPWCRSCAQVRTRWGCSRSIQHSRNASSSRADLAVLQGALSEFEPFGTTSLYDAAAETARSVAARSATHKAIVVLTDGVDTSSAMSPSAVSALASSIDVPVYVVATVPPVDQRATLDEGSANRTPPICATWQNGRAGGCCSPTHPRKRSSRHPASSMRSATSICSRSRPATVRSGGGSMCASNAPRPS